jgi:hypothetical protein
MIYNSNAAYIAFAIAGLTYCTFVPAENSLNAQPSPMRKRCKQPMRDRRYQATD